MPNFGGSTRKFSSTGGAGNFPQLSGIVGDLVMLTPIEIEMVPGYKAKPGEPLKPRLTADTVVLTGPSAGSYDGMWWGQQGIVKKGEQILKRSSDEMILGRLVRLPKKDSDFESREELEEAFSQGGRNAPRGTDYFWVIEDGDTRAADIELATKYLDGETTLTPDDGDDPFEG